MKPSDARTEADVELPEIDLGEDGDEALAERVYRALREAICDFRLPPNGRLVQNALADHLGISRTPVRDSLLRLAQEGLVRALPWRGGYVVSEFTAREVLDIYDVRLPLELLGTREAVGRHTPTQIAMLRELNAQLKAGAAGPVSDEYRLNLDLHSEIIAPSENVILKRMVRQLWTMPSSLRMYHLQVNVGERVDQMAGEHDGIIDALEARDVELTVARLQAHIEGAKRHALEYLDRRER